MRNLKNLVAIIFLSFVIQESALACVHSYYSKKAKPIEPDTQQDLVIFEDGVETWIVQPAFKGNAKDFGMILAFPNQPEIDKASPELFSELQRRTEPPDIPETGGARGFPAGGIFQNTKSLKVIEEKNIGDFSTVILEANDSQALINWLSDNDYQFDHENDIDNFDYYIEKGGYFFVALKVNTEAAKTSWFGNVVGKLTPISFTFPTTTPVVPFRIGRKNMPPVSFTLFTLGKDPYYVPGSRIDYASKLERPIEHLPNNTTSGKWLLKNTITFDAQKIEVDLLLIAATANEIENELTRYLPGISPVVLNQEDIPVRSGIIPTSNMNEDHSHGSTQELDYHLLQKGLLVTGALLILVTTTLKLRRKKRPVTSL